MKLSKNEQALFQGSYTTTVPYVIVKLRTDNV